MSGRLKQPGPSISPVEIVIRMLPAEDRIRYAQTLYSIAKDAIQAQCRDLKVADLEILTALEEKADACFEEWLHSGTLPV